MTSSTPDPIWDLPNVQLQAAEAAKAYAEIMRSRHEQFLLWGARNKIASPIEAIFWMWWNTLESVSGIPHFELESQHEVEAGGSRYRLDFAIPEFSIGIELDGHEFHEKTKEQVTYRNQRDRHLQAAGWTVFHFSGSELYRDQVAVVTAVREVAVARWRKSQGIE